MDIVIHYCKGNILDFGSGIGMLKERLGSRVCSYDIDKSFNADYHDWKDIKNMKFDTVVCNNVLEHLNKDELKATLNQIRALNPKRLIIALPYENTLSKIIMFLLRRKSHAGHKTKYSEIIKEVSRLFELKISHNIFLLNEVSVYNTKTIEGA